MASSRSLILRRMTTQFAAQNRRNHRRLSTSASSSSSDTLHVTENCVRRMKELQTSEESSHENMLRLSVETGGCSGFQYVFDLDDKAQKTGVKLILDDVSYYFVKGATVDYVEELIRSAFVVTTNPSAIGGCGCKSSFMVKL